MVGSSTDEAALTLVVFGGLPGTGKTTLARLVAAELGAAYLRIDAIEAALWEAGVPQTAPTSRAGYAAAHAAAEGSLAAGAAVVIDAVNPVQAARDGWIRLADHAGRRLCFVEVVCSDPHEHRRRVEGRDSDLAGPRAPPWADVERREYEPWREPRLVLDTTGEGIEECVARVLAYVASGD